MVFMVFQGCENESQTKSIEPKNDPIFESCNSVEYSELKESFVMLENQLDIEEIENFRDKDEDKATGDAHFAIGMFIRNEWIRHNNGPQNIKEFLLKKGLGHPDDMSDVILTSFHRCLNNKDIKLDEQVNYYIQYWENVNKDEK